MEALESALSGRRILELANESGIYCGKLMADMGADVIKIEKPGGDATRYIPPFLGDTPHPDRSLVFLYLNTSKRSVTLDITKTQGQAILKSMAATADVLIETFPPGYLDSLGLGYTVLRDINPGLVFTSITGFGQTGPHSNYKSSSLVTSALSGEMYMNGEEDDPPVVQAGSQADIMASIYAAISSMIALYHRFHSGEGQHIDISMQEAVASSAHICGVARWLADGLPPKRFGSRPFGLVPADAYPCKDGLVFLAINRIAHWTALARWINEVTGNQDVLDPKYEGLPSVRQPYRDLLDVYVSELTSGLTVNEVYHEGQKRRIPFTPVNTAQMLTEDMHLRARNYFVEAEHTEYTRIKYPGPPFRHLQTPWGIRRNAPRAGEHNEEVYFKELAISRNEYDSLATAGVV